MTSADSNSSEPVPGVGAWLARHRYWVIGAWVVLAVTLGIISAIVPHQSRNSFSVPGSGSADALEVLSDSYPTLANPIVTVVYATTDGGQITDPANEQLVTTAVESLREVPNAADVTNPTEQLNQRSNISADGTIAFSTMTFTQSAADLPEDTFDELEDAVESVQEAGLQVEFEGSLIDADNPPRGTLSQYADEISIVVAILIVLLAFGSPLVALLPIITALGGLSIALSLLGLLENVFNIGSVNEILGTMLALGVGVDYSLLIVNRYRQLRGEGHDVDTAISLAWSSAGTSVIFAGITVMATTLALIVVGVPFISLLALTTSMFVLITIISALTLLPAMLRVFGERIAWASLPWGREHPTDTTHGFWASWARVNQRHRVVFAIVPVLVLLVVAAPYRSADLGIIDDGALPDSVTQKRAYDLLNEGFGPGQNAPLLVVARFPGDDQLLATSAGVVSLFDTLRNNADVESTSPPVLSDNRDAVLFRVVPVTGPDEEATADLVRELRAIVLPTAVEGTGIDPGQVFVGGETATFIDFTERISDRLVAYILVGVGIAFIALMMAFRSLIVPLKAMIVALLSYFVAYGVVVAVFQWGWGLNVLGLDDTVPIESFFPLFLFAILIGLTLDYEVFLVSRVREEYVVNDDPDESIITGVANTGKVILSAAVIMGSVFFVFVSNPSPVVKMVGFGLGVGVLTDALIGRLMVVPAVLHMLGRRAWWYPRWLDRITPQIDIGEGGPPANTDTSDGAPSNRGPDIAADRT
ncbi:MAG: MMPL family transporter [Actinomycetota bacterium]